MKKKFFFLLLTSFVMNCTQNLVTGSKQLSLVFEEELQTQAKQEYQAFLNANKVVSTTANKDAERVTVLAHELQQQLNLITMVRG